MSLELNTVKVLDGPLAERRPSARVRGGFEDKKKVLVLVVLGVAGVAIAGFQFLTAKGPQTAAAVTVTAPSPGGAPAPAPAGGDAVPKPPEGLSQVAGADTLSVAAVENLVKKFDTYVQDRQVPLDELHVNPFEVALPEAPPETAPLVPTAKAAPVPTPATLEEQKADLAKKKVHDMAARLTLGSVMTVGDRGMAIINGKLCRVGDEVAGFQVETIQPQRVVLICDGEKVELRLRPKKQPQEGV